jgi:cytidylate kinase
MIVTVGGLPGSGSTTLAKRIAVNYGLTHVYAGQIFRGMAQKRGVSLAEFGRMAEEDEAIDVMVDEEQKKLAVDGTVVEGRVTAYLVDADIKIWLTAPLPVRVERVQSREKIVNDITEQIVKRETSERKRYKKYYNINVDDLSVYDLVINTRLWDADGVFAIVKAAIEVRT